MVWDDYRMFLAVARHGTLSAAARALAVTQPTVGRRITAFERRLGAKLFHRRAAGFALTPAGTQLLVHAERMEHDALAAERRVAGRDDGLHGVVRVTASEWLVTHVLARAAAAVLAAHPRVVIELIADHRHLDLARQEADVALRPRRFEHAAIVQRAVGTLAFGLYAAPAYLAERGPLGDGSGHAVIVMTDDVGDVARAWIDRTLPGALRVARTNGRDAMLALARAGVGLAVLARCAGDAEPGLARVAVAQPLPQPALWLGMHRDGRGVPRIRAVAAGIAAWLGSAGSTKLE